MFSCKDVHSLCNLFLSYTKSLFQSLTYGPVVTFVKIRASFLFSLFNSSVTTLSHAGVVHLVYVVFFRILTLTLAISGSASYGPCSSELLYPSSVSSSPLCLRVIVPLPSIPDIDSFPDVADLCLVRLYGTVLQSGFSLFSTSPVYSNLEVAELSEDAVEQSGFVFTSFEGVVRERSRELRTRLPRFVRPSSNSESPFFPSCTFFVGKIVIF